MAGRNKNTILLLVLLLIGLVIGGVIGELLESHIKILAYSERIGFSPVTVDLSIIKFTIGFLMDINLSSIIGIVLAIFVYSKI